MERERVPRDLVRDVAMFIDESGVATIDDVVTRPFRPTQRAAFFGNQSHPVWLRVNLHAPPAGSSWQLDLWPPFIHSATLYEPVAPGSWRRTTLGARYAYVDRPIASLDLVFPLKLPDSQPVTVYIELRTPSAFAVVEVLQPAQVVAREQAVIAVYGVFLGAVPPLLFISFVAWWLTGLRIWLVFAGFDLAASVSFAVLSGLVARFVFPGHANLLNHLHPLGLAGQLLFGAAVFLQFCQFVQAPKWLTRAGQIALLAVPVVLAVLALGYAGLALKINNLAAIYLTALTLPLIYVRNGGDAIVGWVVKASAAFSALIQGLHYLPWFGSAPWAHSEFFFRFSTLPGVVVTAVLTLTIAVRLTQLAMRERMAFREQAREADRQREAAQEASEAKSAFLAYMSHEIRNPLNAVLGLADLAQDPSLPAETRNGYLQMLRDSAEALSHTVGDVLDFSKIESGRMQAEMAPFDLDAMLASIAAVYSPLARQKGLVLDAGTPGTRFGWVRGDPGRLRQVLSNFMSNSLKFTVRGSITLVASRLDEHHFRFEVIDTGPGMSALEQSRLFNPYVQAGGEAERLSGTGLGLAISRELARLMGGDVGVESRLGQGSRFWAQIPLAPIANPPQPSDDQRPEAAGRPMAGKRILVADDVSSNHAVMQALLEREGAMPTLVGDGAQAVEAVRHAYEAGQPFDVVFLDVHMPVMDGLEAVRRIRRLGAAGHVPVVAMSGGVSTEERKRAAEAGMDEFLAKPLSLHRLRGCVSKLTRPASSTASGA